MEKIEFLLENCYGIKKLNHTFSFNPNRVHSIYAPNGFMKTSFSKTLNDLSRGEDSKDEIYPERQNIRTIRDQNGRNLEKDDVFVIEPYNQDFNSDKTSLLLVNGELKSQYDSALKTLADKKKALLDKIQSLSGLTGRKVTPEIELTSLFKKKNIYDVLDDVGDYSSSIDQSRLVKILYSSLFNEKTINFITSSDIKNEIEDYIETYEKLIEDSPILCSTFNHTRAEIIGKNLADNGFFSANHSVNLFNGEEKEEISNPEDLNQRILEEKNNILSNPELKKKFNQVDKKISNNDLRALRDYLNENNDILTELDDIEKLQKNIFRAYLEESKELVSDLKAEYKKNKNTIKEIIKKAKEENTEWQSVVEEFNNRFSVPFKMSIENQDDVILNDQTPVLKFEFKDGEEQRDVSKNDLLKVLSQGEKRALYILNLLFEINVRKKDSKKQLLVIDDIADSFDYKNKYAIVQYLKDVTEEANFVTIFLTHNYDFHRIISSRLNIKRSNRYFINKSSSGIEVYQEKYQKNPFSFWKNNLTNNRYLVSSIPFIRNLAEYCGSEDEFNKLTSMLHIKSDSDTLKKSDLEAIIKTVVRDQVNLVLGNPTESIIDMVFDEANNILSEDDSTAELESKIILAMAIRLKSEKYMINKINDAGFVDSITKNQTMELFNKYKELFPDCESLSVLTDVNIMTPENIHLNSFMYEPILDMSPANLKQLYRNIQEIDT